MIRAAALSLALGLVACGGADKKPAPDPAQPAKNSNPAAHVSFKRKPPPDPEAQRTKQIAEAIERVPKIAEAVAEIRELELKKQVPAESQTSEDFRAYLEREVKKELPADLNTAVSKAVYHLGLVKKPIDLATAMLDAFATQAAAYYDPTVNKFFIVAAFGGEGGLNMITAHELTHGFQHQNFDLLAYYGQKPKIKLTEDELNARRFVVEGEATLVMMVFLGGGKQLLKKAELLESMLSQMVAQVQTQPMDGIPEYIMVPLIDSYTRGAAQALQVFKAGGWKAVDDLYKTPPDSTEQVLHPQTSLVGKRDYPVTITLRNPKALKGYKKLYEDVLGELTWRTYFLTWGVAEPEKLAAGWDGDRIEIWTKDEATTGLVATTWDTKLDAQEFAEGYAKTLTKRFPDAKPVTKGSMTTHARPNGTVVVVDVKGKDVVIADGAPAKLAGKLIKDLRQAKKKKRKGDDGYFGKPKSKPKEDEPATK